MLLRFLPAVASGSIVLSVRVWPSQVAVSVWQQRRRRLPFGTSRVSGIAAWRASPVPRSRHPCSPSRSPFLVASRIAVARRRRLIFELVAPFKIHVSAPLGCRCFRVYRAFGACGGRRLRCRFADSAARRPAFGASRGTCIAARRASPVPRSRHPCWPCSFVASRCKPHRGCVRRPRGWPFDSAQSLPRT